MKNNQGESDFIFTMRRSKTFVLDQVIMKQHARNIMYKGLPENQSLDSELQKNICFFSSQGTIMQKDKGCPRPWKEAIAGQAETTDPAILTVEDCIPLHRKEQHQRETMLT